MQCPACASSGTSWGDHEVDWDFERREDGRFRATPGKVWFDAFTFECTVCGLVLESKAELAAAGLELRWLVPGADPNDYYPGFDEDLLYEAFRDGGLRFESEE